MNASDMHLVWTVYTKEDIGKSLSANQMVLTTTGNVHEYEAEGNARIYSVPQRRQGV